jgi:lysophospholipase L1-like esterase
VTVVAALGDSFTCGVGVGVRVDPAETWVALLTAALPDGRLLRLAEPGARVADVRIRQLPLLPCPVDVATLLVGLNDVGRSGFDATEVGAQLLDVVAALRPRAERVVLGRLHDAPGLLSVPFRVAQAARDRIADVNRAVDEAAGWPGVSVLDLGRVPALGEPGGWSVDRIHPSAAGHQGMATLAVELLRSAGRPGLTPIEEAAVPDGPSRTARGWWAIRHGLPYATRHLRDIGGPMASAVLRRG